MHNQWRLFSLGLLFGVLIFAPAGWSWAEEEEPRFSVDLMPARYTSVKGDSEKFRAHHWMSDGFAAGIKSFEGDWSKDGREFLLEGHAIPQDNDFDVAMEYLKEDAMFMDVHYKMFRKYFDGKGGLYRSFTAYPLIDISMPLELDIGHLAIEVGTASEEYPGLSFLYERHTKDGRKSRLTWASVKEGSTTRKTAPSWQEVEEVADIFKLKEAMGLAGFSVKGEQRLELITSNLLREERAFSTTSTLSDKVIRRQDQDPDARLFSTAFTGDKWMLNDKAFLSMGYRYTMINNAESETLAEYNPDGTLTNAGHTKVNARAKNDYDSHTVTSLLSGNPSSDWNLSTKFKGELIQRRGDSTYPNDSTNPPDFIPNTYEVNKVENTVYRFGELFGARYGGIKHTSLYTEAEFEESRNWLYEQLTSVAGVSGVASPSSNFLRETMTSSTRRNFTLGGRYVPTRWFEMTNQIRRKEADNDYDDTQETFSSSSARSAFFNALETISHEFTNRVTLKPWNWLRTSVRYQYLDNIFRPTIEGEAEEDMNSVIHRFTYDVVLQPINQILATVSFTRDDAKTTTPASRISPAIPGFNADVDSWLFSLSYVPREDLSMYSALVFSRANNFDDFSAIGMPYGVDNERADLTLGMKWEAKKDLTIEPHYGYYRYNTNLTSAEYGDYQAQVVWLDLALKW